jgi:hypothetical protein
MKKERKYENYHIMERHREIKRFLTGGKCEDCGKRGCLIHHIDKTRYNHEVENLRFLCQKCHMKYHKQDMVYHSKYKLLYGKSMDEISTEFSVSYHNIYKLHKMGNLARFIKNPYTITPSTKFTRKFGLTLRELGDKLGVTRERARQLYYSGKIEKRLAKI